MRTRNFELLEENVRHIGIKVLAGMGDNFFNVVTDPDGVVDSRGLNKLRTGDDDNEEVHGSNALTIWFCCCSDKSGLMGRLMTCVAICWAMGVQSGQQRCL